MLGRRLGLHPESVGTEAQPALAAAVGRVSKETNDGDANEPANVLFLETTSGLLLAGGVAARPWEAAAAAGWPVPPPVKVHVIYLGTGGRLGPNRS